MYQKLWSMAVTGTACSFLLFAADSWKNKDSAQWTEEDINKILTDSPWAKEQTVASQRSGEGRPGGMGRRGSIGFPGGGYPGGYPGGGGYPGRGGYPGGGYPGGGSYPGSGSPRGGGYPDDTGAGYPGGAGGAPMNVTIRWESALPVQLALKRQGAGSAEEAKAVAGASPKFYVISVFGFRMPANRRNGNGAPDADSDDDRAQASADALRTRLLDAAQLLPKGGRAIYAQDVEVEGLGSELRFLFPRTPAIPPNAKEVDFILEAGRVKLEHKFHLADMQYQGQPAL